MLCNNGMCMATCPSSVARRRRHQLPLPTSICLLNHETCLVGNSFACVNTQTNLSYPPFGIVHFTKCSPPLPGIQGGGCMEPFLGRRTRGRDCSNIPGVDSVYCKRGACNIESCVQDCQLSNDRPECFQQL